MGIYEEFIRFVKMLNYHTNVEIRFIIASNASCSCLFCVVLVRFGPFKSFNYSKFHFTDGGSPHIPFTLIVKAEHFLEMTLRSQEMLFQRPYIPGDMPPYLLVDAVTVVPPQYIVEYNVQ